MFWRPGIERSGGGSSDHEASYLINNSNAHLPLQLQRQKLPIFQHKNSILYALERCQALILVGETGTGKSTQLPLYLHEAGWTADQRYDTFIDPYFFRFFKICIVQIIFALQ